MARRKLLLDYNKLDSATQVFLMQQEREINSLISQVGLKPSLSDRYSIGKKLVEVRSVLQKTNHKCFEPWIEKVCKVTQPTLYDYIYLYNYTNEYLGGIAALEANPKIAYSVLRELGRPQTPVNIRQKFAERIKSGERVLYEKVKQAIDELLRTIPSNQIDELEKPLIEIKELLNSRDNKESNYHKWLKKYYWVFGLGYKLIESHKKLDDKRIPDFTGIRVYDDFRDIFEIKPPFIPLFQKDGEFTSEFNKAWNQVEEYLNFVIEDKDYLRRKGLNFDNPKCYLILGYNLSEKQIKKIRTKARVNSAIDFRTYNNLIAWAEHTIKSVKKLKGRK
jgi:hypothetical protein